MARLELSTRHGALLVVGEREHECRAAAELALALPFAPPSSGEIVPFLGGRAYFKRDVLRGKSRLRYALKALLGSPVPRLREHANLVWLRERLFQTPRPIAAGCLRAHGLSSLQFLLTEEVPCARTLDEFLCGAAAEERAGVLDEIAREVARMHALRFLHHDLYPRNVLVGEPEQISRVYFLDAWAGGPAPNLRGAAYDLACFLLRANETLTPNEHTRFLDRYVAERAVQERPVERAALVARIRVERRGLIRRLTRRPDELRGSRLPAVDG